MLHHRSVAFIRYSSPFIVDTEQVLNDNVQHPLLNMHVNYALFFVVLLGLGTFAFAAPSLYVPCARGQVPVSAEPRVFQA